MGLGELLWKILCRYIYSFYLSIKFKLSCQCILAIIAEEDEEVNYYALAHLDDLLEKACAREAVVATTSEFVCDNAEILSHSCKRIFKMTFRQSRSVAMCYSLGIKNSILVSLCRPFGNMNEKLIGTRNITKEDLVCYCCYGLSHYKKTISYEDYLHERNGARKMEK